jgi:hypothetical protein
MSEKASEVSGTYGMPHNVGPAGKKVTPSKAVINKVGEAECPDDNLESPVKGEQPDKAVQSGPLKPHVNVEGKEPPTLIKEKKAQHYAIPSLEMYPLDGYDQVIKAASYFDEWRGDMSPEHRREYCENLVKRASSLDIQVSEEIHKYGGAGYAPAAEFGIAINGRKNVLQDPDQVALLDKLASEQSNMQPDDFAVALREFDKLAGIDWMWDEHIMDPFLSTFGKTAESTVALDQSSHDQDHSFTLGNETVYAKQLKTLAATQSKSLKDTFGEDFLKEYRKDPIAIFKSLPLDQKKIICRMATDDSPK